MRYKIHILGTGFLLETSYDTREQATQTCKFLHQIIESQLKIKLKTRIFEILEVERLINNGK